jgi:hypothetical protein
MTTDWITPLYQVTRDALTDGQVVALPVEMYGGARSAVDWLGIETWAWSISGDLVVFSVHTEDMALLAEELGLAAQPRPRVVAVGAAVFMWLLFFAMLGGVAWGAMLTGGL